MLVLSKSFLVNAARTLLGYTCISTLIDSTATPLLRGLALVITVILCAWSPGLANPSRSKHQPFKQDIGDAMIARKWNVGIDELAEASMFTCTCIKMQLEKILSQLDEGIAHPEADRQVCQSGLKSIETAISILDEFTSSD